MLGWLSSFTYCSEVQSLVINPLVLWSCCYVNPGWRLLIILIKDVTCGHDGSEIKSFCGKILGVAIIHSCR